MIRLVTPEAEEHLTRTFAISQLHNSESSTVFAIPSPAW